MIYKIDLNEIRAGKSIAYDNKAKRISPEDLNITEKNIEDYIANNIKEVLPTTDLMTIFQERKWQEEPDIMAMNGKGDLYIFELKRIQASEDNILQLLRYAQKFGSYEYSEINKMYQVYKNDNQFSLLDDLNKNLGNNILSQNDINNKYGYDLMDDFYYFFKIVTGRSYFTFKTDDNDKLVRSRYKLTYRQMA